MLPNSLWVILTTVHLTNPLKGLISVLTVPHDLGRHQTNVMALFLTLNSFKMDSSTELKTIISTLHPDDSTFTFSKGEILRALKRTKSTTATVPDNVCGRTLKHCVEQLGEVFQQPFQTSMNCSTAPLKWKHGHSHPQEGPTKVLNDLRPVALTSLVMKAMERIVKNSITKSVEPLMDPLQVSSDDSKFVINNPSCLHPLFLLF